MTEKVYLIGIILILTVLWSCQDQDQTESTGDSVTANLAFSVSHASGRETRLTNEVVQEEGNSSYRGLEVLSMIPFAISGDKVVSTDKPLRLFDEATQQLFYPKTIEIGDESAYGAFYLYNSYTMMRGTNAFLVYGKAPAESYTKEERGSLVASNLFYPNPEDIKFSPAPIYDDITAPVQALLLAGYLTSIAQASFTEGGNTITWSNTTDLILRQRFMKFIGLQDDGNMLMAGSSANVIAYVNAWYNEIHSLSDTNLTSEGKYLKNAILNCIEVNSYTKTIGETNYTMTLEFDSNHQLTSLGFDESNINYPALYGLPDGAAALRWAKNTTTGEYEFIPQTQTTPMDNINSINRYCYPAELYYYTNSRINTSNDEVNASDYTTIEAWDGENGILSKYENRSWFVTGNTKAVAIQQPLQYAVGRLKMSMKVDKHAETVHQNQEEFFLDDAKGEWVKLTDSSFPLTGMIVGNQHPVDFNFKPILDNGQESHVEDFFIYDSQMKNGTSYYYLTTGEQTILSTLVLQSYDGEEVTIMLEFRNDSGQKFSGMNDGIIYPGTKFYLIGKIKPENAEESEKVPEDVRQRVFTQDYVTTVSTKIESLKNAYSVMPDILGGRLEVGIELTPNWIQATTTNVVLE